MAEKAKNYSAKSIDVLEGLEPVRKRPGMYIGGTDDSGLHHLLKEIIDNSIDEVMNGYASSISVELSADGKKLTVADNGRGIPVDMHPKLKKPALEIIMTTLHAGGKFSAGSYASAGGLHGVGASVVNALSSELIATIERDGYSWQQTFSRGKPSSKLKKLGKSNKTGTKISFIADPEIFKNTKFSHSQINELLEVKALLNKGLKIGYKNLQKDISTKFQFNDGLKSYLDILLERYKLSPVAAESFYLEDAQNTAGTAIRTEIAFCWTEHTSSQIYSYVNGIRTGSGGTHEDGFKSGINKAVRNYISVHDLKFKGIKLTADDIREGLLAVVSVNVPGDVAQLQFQGQTKDKLNNPEVGAPVENLTRSVENQFNTKQAVAAQIIERISLAARARSAARDASQKISRKVGAGRRLNLPGKLADCSSSSADKSELFIVEGESAGGSAKQGRDRKTQAIFPLKGKILNTVSAVGSKISANKELTDLVSVLGCGSGDHLDLKKLRYSKIVILTDADSDGMHIATLLMAFFYLYLPKVVEQGYLFLGMPPLFRIKVGTGAKEESHWTYTEEEKSKVMQKFASRKLTVTRFKGLGEMNPKTLWQTTLDPKTRNLLQVDIGDNFVARQTLEDLLGKDTTERFEMIQRNAHRLEIDV